MRLIAAGKAGRVYRIQINSYFHNYNLLKVSSIIQICIVMFKHERKLLHSLFKSYFIIPTLPELKEIFILPVPEPTAGCLPLNAL